MMTDSLKENEAKFEYSVLFCHSCGLLMNANIISGSSKIFKYQTQLFILSQYCLDFPSFLINTE